MTSIPCLLLATAALHAPDAPRPNVVLILADDLGYGDVGCYNDESKIPTPHLDGLAARGLRFSDAHSPSSVCTPTRYGLLTGRYAWRTALKRSVLWPWDPPLIEDERVTLAELLRDAGYDTACVGKWHLGWDWPLDEESSVTAELEGHTWQPKQRGPVGARVNWARPIAGGPLAHGFEHYFGDDVPNFPPYTFIEDEHVLTRPSVPRPEGMFGHSGPAAPGWDLSLVMPALAQHAAAWIDARVAAADSDPFFLYLPLTAPHTPIAPSPHFAGASEAGPYGDFVCEVDWLVGQVLAALERGHLDENTLVLFTSDNGSPQRDGQDMSGAVGSNRERFGHDSSRPWRGLKSDAWEGGHRVPLIVSWPGQVPAGALTDQPWIHTDLYRTLAALLELKPPQGAAEDSFDLSSALRPEPPPEPIRDHLLHHSGNGLYAIREGHWKLIFGRGSGGFTRWKVPKDAPEGQLYDLQADPGEQKNLYSERPEVLRRLTERMHEFKHLGRSAPDPRG